MGFESFGQRQLPDGFVGIALRLALRLVHVALVGVDIVHVDGHRRFCIRVGQHLRQRKNRVKVARFPVSLDLINNSLVPDQIQHKPGLTGKLLVVTRNQLGLRLRSIEVIAFVSRDGAGQHGRVVLDQA